MFVLPQQLVPLRDHSALWERIGVQSTSLPKQLWRVAPRCWGNVLRPIRRGLASVLLVGALVGSSAVDAPLNEARAQTPVPSGSVAPASSTAPAVGPASSYADLRLDQCLPQKAQPFLIRANWYPSSKDAEAIAKGKEWMAESLRYRTEQYGYFEGYGKKEWNAHPPIHYAVGTKFLGLPIRINAKVVPALRCVELALEKEGLLSKYKPQGYSGIRTKNTYRGAEISNHIFGIAIDIDPSLNTCCNCVKPWSEHRLCQNKKLTVYERMVMPKEWVPVFENYGFYWLGHDVIQDTMHFEFLGDPTKIIRHEGKSP